MKIKHIEAVKELCFKSGRNVRLQESDFKELETTTTIVKEPDANECLPEGWKFITSTVDGYWLVFHSGGAWMGRGSSKMKAIANALEYYFNRDKGIC